MNALRTVIIKTLYLAFFLHVEVGFQTIVPLLRFRTTSLTCGLRSGPAQKVGLENDWRVGAIAVGSTPGLDDAGGRV